MKNLVSQTNHLATSIPNDSPEQMRKSWTSPIYGFFDEKVIFTYEQGRPYVEFTCSAHICKARNGRGVRRFCDTKDKNSTGNMKRHATTCWGDETVTESLNSDIPSVRKTLEKRRDGTITALFEPKGRGVVTYSNTALTKAESRCVHQSICSLTRK